MLLALIRHGQTDWNLALRMQGRADIPLNATGRAQARAAASGIAALAPWNLVVSSTLGRARETAAILAAELGIELGGAYDELVEEEFGDAEGMLVAEVRHRWPVRDTIPNAEPAAEVGPRGLRGLERIRADHPGRSVLAVAHGTLIRRTLAEITGHDAADYPKLDNCSASLIEADASGWTVHTAGGVPLAELLGDAVA
ncbi:histidine phosphatase family protein [Agromyces intestinalis]|uniref:Histidine phosphatase family protein n=1 Tax=Agromyces intestinalis TaxID=2592652 RepID=A0A5C1YE15_9MICO|nr:histidine phosphatase family protein [Agromyces intestinalis]QEO13770.1 histidine phosphatase family protein [Agromyces intestinalis]